jgi:hypothetical protein
MDIYKEHGFKSRDDYLEEVAAVYDLPLPFVFKVSHMLGSAEDFDGLIAMLEDQHNSYLGTQVALTYS